MPHAPLPLLSRNHVLDFNEFSNLVREREYGIHSEEVLRARFDALDPTGRGLIDVRHGLCLEGRCSGIALYSHALNAPTEVCSHGHSGARVHRLEPQGCPRTLCLTSDRSVHSVVRRSPLTSILSHLIYPLTSILSHPSSLIHPLTSLNDNRRSHTSLTRPPITSTRPLLPAGTRTTTGQYRRRSFARPFAPLASSPTTMSSTPCSIRSTSTAGAWLWQPGVGSRFPVASLDGCPRPHEMYTLVVIIRTASLTACLCHCSSVPLRPCRSLAAHLEALTWMSPRFPLPPLYAPTLVCANLGSDPLTCAVAQFPTVSSTTSSAGAQGCRR